MLTLNSAWSANMGIGRAVHNGDKLLDKLYVKANTVDMIMGRGDELRDPVWIGSKLLQSSEKQIRSAIEKVKPLFPALKDDVQTIKNDPIMLSLMSTNVTDGLNRFTQNINSLERILTKRRVKRRNSGFKKPLRDVKKVMKRVKHLEGYRFSLTIVAIIALFVMAIFMSVLVTFNTDSVLHKRYILISYSKVYLCISVCSRHCRRRNVFEFGHFRSH